MAIPDFTIRVEGGQKLRKGLKTLSDGKEYSKRLQRANKAAAETVAAHGKTLAASRTRMGSRAVASIKATAGAASSKVQGGANVPYFAGFNFGSTGRYMQFYPKRHPDAALYTALGDKRPEVIERYVKELEDLARDAFG